jgi:hypothetical protein
VQPAGHFLRLPKSAQMELICNPWTLPVASMLLAAIRIQRAFRLSRARNRSVTATALHFFQRKVAAEVWYYKYCTLQRTPFFEMMCGVLREAIPELPSVSARAFFALLFFLSFLSRVLNPSSLVPTLGLPLDPFVAHRRCRHLRCTPKAAGAPTRRWMDFICFGKRTSSFDTGTRRFTSATAMRAFGHGVLFASSPGGGWHRCGVGSQGALFGHA